MWDARTTHLLEALRRSPATFSALRLTISNPRTLSRRLRELVGAGWVVQEGRLYRLTDVGASAGELLRKLEELPHFPHAALTVERIPNPAFARIVRWTVERLRDRFPAALAAVLVFGSVARGQETADSDLDLLLLVRGDASALEEVRQGLVRLQRDLRETSEYRTARRAGVHPVLDGHLILLERSGRLYRLYLDALSDGIPVFDPERRFAELRQRMRERLQRAGAVRIETPEGLRYWKLGDPALLGAAL